MQEEFGLALRRSRHAAGLWNPEALDMDAPRFDLLAQTFSTMALRRTALHGVLGVALSAFLPSPLSQDAEAKRKKKKKKKPGVSPPTSPPPADSGPLPPPSPPPSPPPLQPVYQCAVSSNTAL
jgi:hypothetical protein